MRVLVSAYACEPGKGSEPGVGWNWALQAARVADEVVVLTRTNNRSSIDEACERVPANLHFEFLDLGEAALKLKGGSRRARPYYVVWQRAARARILRLHQEQPFDLIHHLTWASISLPVGASGVTAAPLIVGPVGGGVGASWSQWRDFGLRGAGYELARAALQLANQVNPQTRRTWQSAHTVLAQNEETRQRLPKGMRHRVMVVPNAGIDSAEVVQEGGRSADGGVVRCLFAARIIPLKGLRTAIRALSTPQGRNLRLEVLGDGPDRRSCERLARRLGITDRVLFRGMVPRHVVLERLDESDVLLLPTQHDEGPLIVIEAMARGVRPVVLERGGPAVSVGQAGVVVSVKPVRTLPNRLATAVCDAWALPPALPVERSSEYVWDRKADVLRRVYASALVK